MAQLCSGKIAWLLKGASGKEFQMGGNVTKCAPLVRKKGNSWSRMFLSHCWLHSLSYCQECVSVGVQLCVAV